jgi:hypothetical protein
MELNEWLKQYGVSHVAMEATGVYWKPVWHLLEGDFELVLANAQHIRNVPGRKTDVNESITALPSPALPSPEALRGGGCRALRDGTAANVLS